MKIEHIFISQEMEKKRIEGLNFQMKIYVKPNQHNGSRVKDVLRSHVAEPDIELGDIFLTVSQKTEVNLKNVPLKITSEADFGALFDLHYEELCRVVFPIIQDESVAEDIVQDVFVKLWERRAEVSVSTSFKGYLYKSVIYKSFDHLRKVKNASKLANELKLFGVKYSNNADERIRENEVKVAIARGMSLMSDHMKIIFQLSRFSGLKNREIAEELNISIKTVESNMGKALKIMHSCLAHFCSHLPLVIWLLNLYTFI